MVFDGLGTICQAAELFFMLCSTIIANGFHSEDFQQFPERHATTASGALSDKLSVKAK